MQRHVLSDLFGLKKTVRGCGGEVHRSYYDKKARWIRDLPCAEMREGETGGVRVAFEKFFLHKEVCLFYREACRPMTIQDVAKELKLDWHTVKELDKQHMEKQPQRTGVPAPGVIGIDEISFRKGHTYHNCDKRFGEETTDKVRRQVQVGRRYGYVL